MSRLSEHACPLPQAQFRDIGRLYLCDCGRLYVGRAAWVDAVCPQRICRWTPVTARRWWRR